MKKRNKATMKKYKIIDYEKAKKIFHRKSDKYYLNDILKNGIPKEDIIFLIDIFGKQIFDIIEK